MCMYVCACACLCVCKLLEFVEIVTSIKFHSILKEFSADDAQVISEIGYCMPTANKHKPLFARVCAYVCVCVCVCKSSMCVFTFVLNQILIAHTCPSANICSAFAAFDSPGSLRLAQRRSPLLRILYYLLFSLHLSLFSHLLSTLLSHSPLAALTTGNSRHRAAS